MHWSGNFDEAQDFEARSANFAGGSGLMNDGDFALLRDPLGPSKAGVSADLDALAAYMASLDSYEPSPHRNADGSLTTAAAEGKNLFAGRGCLACHGGPDFSGTDGQLHDVGTLKSTSGGRLGASLAGIDTPTLRDAWSSTSFLHDGSAASVADAIAAHTTLGSFDSGELARLSAYVMQIGSEE